MKKDRIRMFRDALSFVVVALTFTLGSCTEELLAPPIVGGEDLEVRVSFSANATRGIDYNTKLESRIDRMTVFVFNEDGSKLEAMLDEDVRSSNSSLATSQPKWEKEKKLIIRSVPDLLRDKQLFAIANWEGAKYIDKTTFTMERLLNTEVPLKPYPIQLMMSAHTKVSKGYIYDLEMSRLVAGLDVDVIAPKNHPQIKWMDGEVKIRNLYGSIFLFPDYGSTRYPHANSQELRLRMIQDRSYTDPDNIRLECEPSPKAFMAPNYWQRAVSVVVQMPYKNRITGVVEYDNYYEATIKYVEPNHIYKLELHILGVGLPFDRLTTNVNIEDQLTINNWEDGGMGDVEAPNYYFNIDRTRLEFQFLDTSLQSTIATNVPDWKLVQDDGTTVLSFADNRTTTGLKELTYTLSGNAANAVVTVRNSVGRSITPMRLFFVAKNLKVPFMIVSNNGFIPNSTLIEAGWPLEKLPKNGLQLAKRGYKVLPSGVAGSDDVLLQWKTSNTSTPGTSYDLGMGESNTAAMNGVEHPAAQYCREMGEGWFLPSSNELWDVIRAKGYKLSLFGHSYSFNANVEYWTSSESADTNSYYVLFGGARSMLTKSTLALVRCVKAI